MLPKPSYYPGLSCRGSARTPATKIERGKGATKRRASCNEKVPGSCYGTLGFPYGPLVPLTGPLFPLVKPLKTGWAFLIVDLSVTISRGHPSLCWLGGGVTFLTEMMADEFNLLRPEIKNYKAEADAYLIIPIPGQSELHGRCRCGVLLSTCFVHSICCRSNCGDGGIRITLQTQRQI